MNLPKHLTSFVDKEDVKVPVEGTPQREITPQNMNAICEGLGLTRISGDQARALRELGIAARSLGILETIQGTVLLTQQALADGIVKLSNALGEPSLPRKDLREHCKTLGYMAGQLAKLNTSATKSERTVVEAILESDKKRRASFAPGRAVGPTVEVVAKVS